MKYKIGQLWYNAGGKFLIKNIIGDHISIYYFDNNISRVWYFEDLIVQTYSDVYIGQISRLEMELL